MNFDIDLALCNIGKNVDLVRTTCLFYIKNLPTERFMERTRIRVIYFTFRHTYKYNTAITGAIRS